MSKKTYAIDLSAKENKNLKDNEFRAKVIENLLKVASKFPKHLNYKKELKLIKLLEDDVDPATDEVEEEVPKGESEVCKENVSSNFERKMQKIKSELGKNYQRQTESSEGKFEN